MNADFILNNTKEALINLASKYPGDTAYIPIGLNCYSSFLAKSFNQYIPSIFGFRSINDKFICNYFNEFKESNPFILTGREKKIDNKVERFRETDIQALKNAFGLFLLNHDYSGTRPFRQENLNNEVISRLLFLELTTHYVLFSGKFNNIIFFGGGPKPIKEKMTRAIQENAKKIKAKKINLLFIREDFIHKDEDLEPKCLIKNGEICISINRQNPSHSNVASNWQVIKPNAIKFASNIIKNDYME